jgi:hypothetical protein
MEIKPATAGLSASGAKRPGKPQIYDHKPNFLMQAPGNASRKFCASACIKGKRFAFTASSIAAAAPIRAGLALA